MVLKTMLTAVGGQRIRVNFLQSIGLSEFACNSDSYATPTQNFTKPALRRKKCLNVRDFCVSHYKWLVRGWPNPTSLSELTARNTIGDFFLIFGNLHFG